MDSPAGRASIGLHYDVLGLGAERLGFTLAGILVAVEK